MGGDAATIIVVLGAGVWPGGAPSHALERRVLYAVGLANQIPGSHLLMTGGLGRHPPSEAEVMARVATQAGFPVDRITEERASHSTLDSAEHCSRLLRELNHRPPPILVSDRYHLRRAALAFRLHGIRTRTTGPAPGAGEARRSVEELLKLPWLLMRFALRRVSCGATRSSKAKSGTRRQHRDG